MQRTALVFVFALITSLVTPAAHAGIVYDFDAITSNGAVGPDVGEAQMSVCVSDLGGGQVQFDFTNAGPEQSVLTQIYFDGDILDSLDLIINGVGTAFDFGGSPPDLPSGENVDPDFDSDFRVSEDDNGITGGVNPGETVGIVASHTGTFADVIAAIESGELRFGLHIQSFSDGNSESFVNSAPTPGALALLAVAGLCGQRRRRGR